LASSRQDLAQRRFDEKDEGVKQAELRHQSDPSADSETALSVAMAARAEAQSELDAANETLASARSRLQSEGAISDDIYGLTYFLPRQLATVSARRTPSALAKAIGAVAKAQGKADAASVAVAAKEAAVKTARDALVASPNNDTSRRVLQQALNDAEADLRLARTSLSAARTALDTATSNLHDEAKKPRSADASNFDVKLTIELQSPTPDPQYGFRLTPEHSSFRDDEHKFTIDANGLLSTANTVSVDRTVDVLLEVAAFSGAITRPFLNGEQFSGEGEEDNDCMGSPNQFSGTVDFASSADVERLNDQLQCLGVRLQVEGRVWSGPSQIPAAFDNDSPLMGIVYRRPVELFVTVEKCTKSKGDCTQDDGWFATEQLPFMLPQAGPISVLRQDADALTRTTYDIAFDNGIPTSYSSNRPSTALAAASAPLRIVNSVLDGASEYASRLLSIQIGQTKQLTELSAAELSLINQQAQYDLALANNHHTASLTELGNQQALALAGVNNQQALVAAEQQLASTQAQLEQAQLAAQQALALAGISNQQALALAGITNQQALALAGITNEQALISAQQTLDNSLIQNAITQAGVPAQLSAAQFAAQVAELREQNIRSQLESCIEQATASVSEGETPDITPCLAEL